MSKLLIIGLLAVQLHATTYYISSTASSPPGSDSNTPTQAQSPSTPWATIQHSVNNMACGDLLVVISDGNYIQDSDALFPYFSGCGRITTIQSSLINQFSPSGFRTNPANDSGLYGKLQFNYSGWSLAAEVHGGWIVNANNVSQGTSPGCGFSSISPTDGSAATVFTIQASGTVNTSGTSVTWVSGTAFAPNWAGQIIVINSVQYYVSTVNSSTSITLVSSAGTQSAVSFSQGSACYGGLMNLANGSQVELELNGYGVPAATTLPAPLPQYQVLYVVNCSTSPGCNTGLGSYFGLATSPGGTPISVNVGSSPNCLTLATCPVSAVVVAQPVNVTTTNSATYTPLISTPSTFLIPDNFVVCGAASGPYIAGLNAGAIGVCFANGTPVTFNSVGLLSFTTSLPAPLQANTIYYVVNLSGRLFQVSTTPGGSPVAITAMGTGPLTVASAQSPSQWKFSGLEAYFGASGYTMYGFLLLGSGLENSTLSMVNHIEVDHVWMHDNPSANMGSDRGIFDNGQNLYIHDNYISGNRSGESQAISGYQALGPTAIVNNLLEGSGENTLYGGSFPTMGGPNANHSFLGNYYYKPPVWVRVSGTVDASGGGCWYDTYDPAWSGGQWYQNTSSGAWFQCNSSFTWASVGSGPIFNNPTIKDMAEHKSGTHFTYSGNLFNYSPAQSQGGETFNNSQELGSGAGIANDHITVQNNKITHALTFVGMYEYCASIPSQPCPTPPSNHVYQNNLAVLDLNSCGPLFINSNSCGWQMYVTQFTAPAMTGMLWNHNTVVVGDTWQAISTGQGGAPPRANIVGSDPRYSCYSNPYLLTQIVMQNSIHAGNFEGDCVGVGTGGAIPQYFQYSTFRNMVLLNANSSGSGYATPNGWGTGNTFSIPLNSTGFPTAMNANYVSSSTGDYHQAVTSPYSAANSGATLLSTDGTDLGADIDMVNLATSGAQSGTPTWNEMYDFSVTPGSASLVIGFNAPTSASCTAYVYQYQARNASGSQVASVADTASTSVSQGTYRRILITGLTPGKVYPWVAASCAGGVLMLKANVQTRASGSGNYAYTVTPGQAVKVCSNATMTTSCSTQSAATPQVISVASNTPTYWSPLLGGAVTQVGIIVPP